MTLTARVLASLRTALPLVLLTTSACSGPPEPVASNAGGLPETIHARGCPDGRDLEVSFTDEDGELQVRGRCLDDVSLRPDRDEPHRDRLPVADR